MKRNPNYHGPRPQGLEAIALREGIDPGQAVARIQAETWDGITTLGDPILGPRGDIAKEWGAGGISAAKHGRRYYAIPSGGLGYLDFNASRPLFSDPRVRQAVAYALDRPALSNYGDALPTDQLLPPNQPGSQANVFPLDGPDLQKAKALMNGRRRTAVLVTNPFGGSPSIAQEIMKELAPIGIDVRIKRVQSSFLAIHEPGAPYDLKVGGNDPLSIGPMSYVEQLLTAFPPGAPPLDQWSTLPPDWESPVVRALTSRLADVRTDAEGLALLHGPIQREVPMTGISYSVAGAFFSRAWGAGCSPRPASVSTSPQSVSPRDDPRYPVLGGRSRAVAAEAVSPCRAGDPRADGVTASPSG